LFRTLLNIALYALNYKKIFQNIGTTFLKTVSKIFKKVAQYPQIAPLFYAKRPILCPAISPTVKDELEDAIAYRVNVLTGEALYCSLFQGIGKHKVKAKVY